jgi:hypothetical protein
MHKILKGIWAEYPLDEDELAKNAIEAVDCVLYLAEGEIVRDREEEKAMRRKLHASTT